MTIKLETKEISEEFAKELMAKSYPVTVKYFAEIAVEVNSDNDDKSTGISKLPDSDIKLRTSEVDDASDESLPSLPPQQSNLQFKYYRLVSYDHGVVKVSSNKYYLCNLISKYYKIGAVFTREYLARLAEETIINKEGPDADTSRNRINGLVNDVKDSKMVYGYQNKEQLGDYANDIITWGTPTSYPSQSSFDKSVFG